MTIGEDINQTLTKNVKSMVKQAKTGEWIPGSDEAILRGQTPGQAGREMALGMSPVGAVNVGGAIGGFFKDRFIQGMIGMGLLNMFSGEVREQMNRIVPLNEMKVTIIKDLYVNAPSEDIAARARNELDTTLTGEGYSPNQIELYMADADRERAVMAQRLGQVPEGFALPGETPQQAATRYLGGIEKERESQNKLTQENAAAAALGPFPEINIKNLSGQQLEEATRLVNEMRRNPETFNPEAKVKVRQLQESMLRQPGQPLPSLASKAGTVTPPTPKQKPAASPAQPASAPLNPLVGYEDPFRRQSIMLKKKKGIK